MPQSSGPGPARSPTARTPGSPLPPAGSTRPTTRWPAAGAPWVLASGSELRPEPPLARGAGCTAASTSPPARSWASRSASGWWPGCSGTAPEP